MVHKTFKVAEVEISYRPNYKVSERPQISKSNDAYQILIQQWSIGKIELLEEFKILLLNRRNRVLGIVDISQGGLSGTVADPKIIFAAALKSCASGIILAHNHPSGELDPSCEDIAITNKLKAGALLLDLKILDHLIVTRGNFYSFADEGLM
ncbi:DNA repair protein RadC [Pedobacter westerhofensis]|uniref:DNA repair protein RadC n=1 Tax=Pedobacter westerhofensis TaxID=425512 RepID=A0A521FUB2_9SPHI|nr:JAB domain-containing protein [Pedobacter westerhofensis]SMO99753.1 DNA repair protein RadC [Pedobacter westerhofensis]